MMLAWITSHSHFELMARDSPQIKRQKTLLLRELLDKLHSIELIALNKSMQEQQERSHYLQESLKILEKIGGNIDKKIYIEISERIKLLITQRETQSHTESAKKFLDLKQYIIQTFKINCSPALTPDLTLAKVQYQDYCSHCHGNSGDGQGILAPKLPIPPTNFRGADFAKTASPLMILNSLLHKKKDNPMPTFEGHLSAQELWSMSFYVSAFSVPVKRKHQKNWSQQTIHAIESGKIDYKVLVRHNNSELKDWISSQSKVFNNLTQEKPADILHTLRASAWMSKEMSR